MLFILLVDGKCPEKRRRREEGQGSRRVGNAGGHIKEMARCVTFLTAVAPEGFQPIIPGEGMVGWQK